jgi:TRAP-type C4-dicarboxylate transport system permease small subunit
MSNEHTLVDEFSDFLINIVKWIEALLLVMMVVSVALQVISRKIVEAPLPWTEEVARFCMVWMVFLGASVLIKTDENTTVTFIQEKMSPFLRAVVQYVINLLMLFMMCGLFMLSLTQLSKYSLTEISPALRISMLIPKSCLIFGSMLIALQIVCVLIKGMKKIKETGRKGK